MKIVSYFFRGLLLVLIWGYRFLISPFTPPSCRFEPTCSSYAEKAIRQHGTWVGFWLTVKRLSRCHPIERFGGESGFDPVPVEILPAPWYAPWRLNATQAEMNKNDYTHSS